MSDKGFGLILMRLEELIADENKDSTIWHDADKVVPPYRAPLMVMAGSGGIEYPVYYLTAYDLTEDAYFKYEAGSIKELGNVLEWAEVFKLRCNVK